MAVAHFRLDAQLRAFLPRGPRSAAFDYRCARAATRNNALEAHARPFSLCLACNVPLAPTDKREVIDHLPEQVARAQQRFWRCPRCRRVYWPGSHYERMRAALAAMLGGEVTFGP